ncbi:MAG: hypothetical protein CMG20_00440 [Candidatus Marinimicrobia bacterium]|nr:hypothetical protein [Candidatus Neomarinimicrobiota bacterium]|tara:strand:- start:11551 stop:13173 length:1623 start_codon:yes stop_codon:yes gene_type:complete
MKQNITIKTDKNFPYLGQGINFNETCFNLKFDASIIQKTSELIWQPNSTLPYSTLQPLPHPFSSISDLASEMAVNNHGKTGLIGKKELLDEVLLLDDGLMNHFILHVKKHIEKPTRKSAQLIADIRCWTSWLANGIKIEPIFNGEKKACSFIPWPLSGLLLLSSKITGQQAEFEYAADYVLRSGILPEHTLDSFDNMKDNIDYIRSIKPVVSFHDFDGNEQGFRMTHLAMERTSKMMIQNSLDAIDGNNIAQNLEQIELALKQSNQLFNCMWKVSEPLLYNKEVRIFIQGLYGNQGSIYDDRGLFFEGCGETYSEIHNMKGCYIEHLHGQTGANSSYHPIADEITGIGKHTHAYVCDNEVDTCIIENILSKGFIADEDLPCDCEIDSLTKLLKSFRVGYRPPAHHAMIVKTREKLQNSSYFDTIESDQNLRKSLASSVRWIIQHRIDHYKMVVGYILKAPDPYRHQTKAKGTGGSPTPSFLPKMFTNTIDRLDELVGNTDIAWANELIAITNGHKDSMEQFKKIALQAEKEDSQKNRSLS